MALTAASAPFLRLSQWQKALFLVACLVILDVAGFSQKITAGAAQGLLPIKQLWVKSLNSIYVSWQSVQKLPKSVERIQDLELRLAESSSSLAELATLRRENEELRFLLTNTDRSNDRTIITAPVIAFAHPALGVGSQAGVTEGAVVLSRNTLLGQVTQVSAYDAQVTLLLETAARPVLAQTDAGVKGIITGDGRKVLFTQVPKESVLTIGERVVTLGQPQIEQNLLIGKIVKVINEPAASVQSAVIEQSASFFETPVVEVR